MVRALVAHLRSHVISYLALGCSLLALAAASGAAPSFPASGSSVLHWAKVGARGQLFAASSRAHVQPFANGFFVDWRGTIPWRRCITLATVRGIHGSVYPIETEFDAESSHLVRVAVQTFNTANPTLAVSQAINVAVIC